MLHLLELASIPSVADAPESVEHEVVQVRHPYWKDSLRIAEGVACRVHGGDCATIIERSEKGFFLDWDRWGKELFLLQPDGRANAFKRRSSTEKMLLLTDIPVYTYQNHHNNRSS